MRDIGTPALFSWEKSNVFAQEKSNIFGQFNFVACKKSCTNNHSRIERACLKMVKDGIAWQQIENIMIICHVCQSAGLLA